MHVPILDLTVQYAAIKDELMQAISEVCESQSFALGPAVAQFEENIAAYCGSKHAIGVSSGTDALLVSLMALGIGQGDEVITTPFTFFATAGAIWRVGARCVFVDIQPETFNIDPAQVEAAVTEKTKAIMPVHLFGQTADMDPMLAVAASHDLFVVEDAAQAIGATYRGRRAGSIGAIGCFSFYPSKNLGGLGDGGMITTQDEELAARLRQCRSHGSGPKYFHHWVGGNFRLDTIQAAGLLVKLRHLDGWSAKRRANAARYDELLADCPPVVTPTVSEGNVSIFNQYVIRVPRRDALQAHLTDRGIGTVVYYPLSLHQQDCFTDLGYKTGDFPVSEKAATEALALPIYPELTDEQIVTVAESIKEFLS